MFEVTINVKLVLIVDRLSNLKQSLRLGTMSIYLLSLIMVMVACITQHKIKLRTGVLEVSVSVHVFNGKNMLCVRISSVVYSIWENTVDEHT